MRLFKKVSVLFFLAIIMSCNTKLFINKHCVVEKAKGLAVFIDKESREFANMGKDDVFTDSLIPDFFIPYNFNNKIIKKEDVDKVLLSSPGYGASFFYLIRDCNETNRQSSIERECKTLFLDKNIDDYLHSNKIYVLPVKLDYLRSSINAEYYDIHKNLLIEYKGKSLDLTFSKGSYEILRMDVLEYNWE